MSSKQFFLTVWIASAAILSLSGCIAPQASFDNLFEDGGIPSAQYRVGGGFQIRCIAPEDGVVYLVDNRTRTLLVTESLLRNQVFEFFPTEEVVDGFDRVGIDLSEGDYVIYFVPASKLYRR